ncbi:Pimeloyl-ACP methyl ester carboxylesterase [Asanoa hainanensis]|uniref:Pimeloyl-ACP methyl ester carboxylesterase n=1 Tax=Asanoa hainanensis TaxID=560556 RepID=A0A239I8H6_9ACTN|nr:alpha/beta hydrolase [Asanoa hainanensis]SNS89857.1 Pimeloyl-ACP methyl ester carboxylesterase [Asanoa hainanensis]
MAKTQQLKPQFRRIDGLAVRYAESAPRNADALLLSPWPESVYAFDQMWSQLAEDTHLVAIDLPGFGRSQRRDEMMSPHAMGDFVVRVADEFELEQPHMVGPDVGTGTALFAAANHPGRLRSLVVGSGASSVPITLEGPLRDWVLSPSVDEFRAVDGRVIVNAALGTIQDYDLPGKIKEDYLSSYEGDRFVESMSYARAYPEDLPVLRDKLGTLDTPVEIIAGRDDRAVPTANAQFLHDRLPHSKLDIIDAAHFAWEEAPTTYADLVTSWWTGGYRKP